MISFFLQNITIFPHLNSHHQRWYFTPAHTSLPPRYQKMTLDGPTTPAPEILVTKKSKKSSKSVVAPGAGVCFISRIPHGFYEDQMRAYFSQFGEITRLRMARNRRTGASKHYAYIEFRHHAVAKIVAETMHNYLMCGKLLQVHLVDPATLHPEVFKGCNKKFKVIPWKKINMERYNSELTPEKLEEQKKRQSAHVKSVEERCRELGIEWDANDL